jgi:hypothetical protein
VGAIICGPVAASPRGAKANKMAINTQVEGNKLAFLVDFDMNN